MKRSYSKYSAIDDLLWLILRPWIFIPRVLYILLTFIFLFLRILFQGNSKNKNVQNNINGDVISYSIMENGIYGSPSKGRNGNIGFNLNNILEVKIKSSKDTLNNMKKIKILESFNISSSYNIFKDSLKFSNINLNARTRIFDIFDINFSSIYDPYVTNKSKTNNLNLGA